MKFTGTLLLLLACGLLASGQKQDIASMKLNLEKAQNPIAYAREVLKKQTKLDTIIILNTVHFSGLADSLAYHGKIRKVYGPYEKKYLVQILGKLPNTFTRVSQIFIDTSLFPRRTADSLANNIMERIKLGSASFEEMAQTYSMGGEGVTKGDLGWIARGSIIPEMDKEITRHKKGEVFKVWSRTGLHIVKKTADPKQDTGFVLLLRTFL
ncbi:MAG: peptidylprolyl isomerase [Bacteroidota bacterium]|nr:peptidylprolyl isomerase [Bacteroidota bacterium]